MMQRNQSAHTAWEQPVEVDGRIDHHHVSQILFRCHIRDSQTQPLVAQDHHCFFCKKKGHREFLPFWKKKKREMDQEILQRNKLCYLILVLVTFQYFQSFFPNRPPVIVTSYRYSFLVDNELNNCVEFIVSSQGFA